MPDTDQDGDGDIDADDCNPTEPPPPPGETCPDGSPMPDTDQDGDGDIDADDCIEVLPDRVDRGPVAAAGDVRGVPVEAAELARTGTGSLIELLLAALVLIGAGSALVNERRRRQPAAAQVWTLAGPLAVAVTGSSRRPAASLPRWRTLPPASW
jgi:hypothetical protein